MNESDLPYEPQLDRWAIPLDEPTLAFVPPSLIARELEEPEPFPLLPDSEPYPTEGHHPRLFRFGEAA